MDMADPADFDDLYFFALADREFANRRHCSFWFSRHFLFRFFPADSGDRFKTVPRKFGYGFVIDVRDWPAAYQFAPGAIIPILGTLSFRRSPSGGLDHSWPKNGNCGQGLSDGPEEAMLQLILLIKAKTLY